MKKTLKIFMSIVLTITLTVIITGCGKETNSSGENNQNETSNNWPTEISYVPHIPYEGKGKIVKQEEDTSYGNEYMIYIKGSTLDSANKYIDKLYSNGYQVLNMFSDEGKYLKSPGKNSFYKTGFENSDGTIKVVMVLHDGKEEYDLVITFADMSE